MKPLSTNDASYLKIADVAELLNIPSSTAYHLVKDGEIPAVKIGKHWRVSRDQLLTWLQHQSTNG